MPAQTDKSSVLFGFPESLSDVQQTAFPSTFVLQQFTDMARSVTEAQLAFSQAFLRANMSLMGAWLGGAAEPSGERDLGPCAAAKQPEFMNS